MKVYEISRKALEEIGSIRETLNYGYYTIWTDERIKEAFNFGNGTKKDFDEYKENNKKYSYFVEC